MGDVAHVVDGGSLDDRRDLIEVVVAVRGHLDLRVDVVHHQDHVLGPEALARDSSSNDLARDGVP